MNEVNNHQENGTNKRKFTNMSEARATANETVIFLPDYLHKLASMELIEALREHNEKIISDPNWKSKKSNTRQEDEVDADLDDDQPADLHEKD